jgi:transketolase
VSNTHPRTNPDRVAALRAIAAEVRVLAINAIATAKLGHVGGDFSVADILTTLYFGVLRIDPARPDWPDRDRLILSKGHCSAALYSVLARAGFIPRALLGQFMAPLSALSGHPNRSKVPGVEANTGALGHGLPIGVGCAIAARLAGAEWRTFVVLGDGELQEGSNWEAAMAAGHRGLGGLTAIVDRNGLQQGARTEDTNRLEPLADKWRAFGWEACEVDGHDHAALLEALGTPHTTQPRCVIARTHKGRGVSFMEDRVEWHHKVPSPEQVELALKELSHP